MKRRNGSEGLPPGAPGESQDPSVRVSVRPARVLPRLTVRAGSPVSPPKVTIKPGSTPSGPTLTDLYPPKPSAPRTLVERIKAARAECEPRLNAITNRLNEGIAEVEEALAGLQLGVAAGVSIDDADGSPDDDMGLAFRKHDGSWRLVIDDYDPHTHQHASTTLLIEASRALRLRAVGLLPGLVEKLVENANSEIDLVAKSVESLSGLAAQLREAKS